MPYVTVVPDRRTPGASTLDADVPGLPVTPLKDALEATYETDTHLAPALVYNGTGPLEFIQPRPNKALGAVDLSPFHASLAVGAVFIDVDNEGHEHWTPAEAEEALEALEDLEVLEHAAVYATRAGWRAVYKVEPPIPVDRYRTTLGHPGDETKGIPPSGLLAWFRAGLGSGAPGEVDPTCNQWTRIFRAPRVMRDGCPTDSYMDLDALDGEPLDVTRWLEAAKAEAPTTPGAPTDLERPYPDALTPTEWAGLGLENALRRRWPGSDGIPGMGPAIRKQRPWWAAGERNTATHDGVALLVELLYAPHKQNVAPRPDPQATATTVWRAVAPCVIGACNTGVSGTPEADALTETWNIIQRRIEHAEGEANAAEQAVRDATVAREVVADALTEEDEEGELWPIVVHGAGYYVLDARNTEVPTYYPFTKNANLWPSLLLKGCGDVDRRKGEGPLGLRLRDSKGGMRHMASLVHEYGTMVTDVIVSHGLEQPLVNAEHYQLHLPGAKALAVAPRYDEQIDTWLRYLGGDDEDALLDWLATLTRLDRPTCALYLQGAPGVGKGLFAACVSSVFGRSFVSFTEAISRFNDGLNKSPVVFLDEKAEGGSDNKDPSGAFRSLVAEDKHRTEAKGQAMTTLRGACRVIIAANNADALPLVGAHTQADIKAVVSRIRWMGCDPMAAEYLRSIGGRDTTGAWTGKPGRPGTFAQHVRWLELNREVQVGSRYLVPGKLREYHELLALSSERLRVLHAVGAAILAGEKGMKRAGVGIESADMVWVNVTKLRAQWPTLTQDNRSPSQGVLTGALRALAGVTDGARRDGVRVYLVPVRYVLLAAGQMGLPGWDIKKAVEKLAKSG